MDEDGKPPSNGPFWTIDVLAGVKGPASVVWIELDGKPPGSGPVVTIEVDAGVKIDPGLVLMVVPAPLGKSVEKLVPVGARVMPGGNALKPPLNGMIAWRFLVPRRKSLGA